MPPKLIPFLRRRRQDVVEGLEVDGIQMVPLKTLIFDFDLFDDVLPELRELVEEGIDLESVPEFVEIKT